MRLFIGCIWYEAPENEKNLNTLIKMINAVTAKSGDEGIYGIVNADQFGFDVVYIQAKQWDVKSVVRRPEIQEFLGALVGKGATIGYA